MNSIKVWGLGVLVLPLALICLYFDSTSILFESRESKTTTGEAVFNRIQFQPGWSQDVWLMQQSHHGTKAPDMKWDRVAIVVDKMQSPAVAKYYQLAPGEDPISMQNQKIGFRVACQLCHSSGPRAIRPNWDSKMAQMSWKQQIQLVVWNLRIKSYGPVKNVAGAGNQPIEWQHPMAADELRVKACTRCHNGQSWVGRAPLQRQNFLAIRFMLENQLMPPPGFPLSESERLEVKRFIGL